MVSIKKVSLKCRLKNLIGWITTALKHSDQKPPVFALHPVQGLRIHIGCGDVNIQGWINIDARPASHVHIVTTDLSLDQFSSHTIDEIYLCHVLEHFSSSEVRVLFNCFFEKLKPGGMLRISVPSFDVLVEIYQQNSKNIDSIHSALMGGQDYEYNYHKTAFNESSLTRYLETAGFVRVSAWDAFKVFGDELRDWSAAKIRVANSLQKLSLNLQGSKPST